MKVAILGGGTRDRKAVLAYDKTWEVWGMNAIRPEWMESVTFARMFNLHRYEHLLRDWEIGLINESLWAKRNADIPFYVIGPWPKDIFPNAVEFPREKLARQPNPNYHASSFDWMVAYAVALGASQIAIHGCGFALDSWRDEPVSARACLEYWLGYAIGKGVKVIMGTDTDLFQQYHLVRSHSQYGYDDISMVEDRR